MRNGAFFYRCPEYACQHFFSLPIQATRRTESSLFCSSSSGAIRTKKSLRKIPETFSKQQTYAFLAISMSWVNAAGSLIAISESILRLISMPAVFRPCMKVE